MSQSPLRIAMKRVKQHAAAVVTAALIFGGIYQIVSTLKYPIGAVILRLANAILEREFRDQSLLPQYGPMPWQVIAKAVAVAVILIVLGGFLGLWVTARSKIRHSPES